MNRSFAIGFFSIIALALLGSVVLMQPLTADAQLVKPILPNCSATGISGPRCTLVNLVELIVNITRWLRTIAIPIAIALFLYGGYTIMTAGGDQGKVSHGRAIITTAVIGFVIVMAAWLIIYTIFKFLTSGETGGLG